MRQPPLAPVRPADVDGQDGPPVLAVAEADEFALAQDRGHHAELLGVLEGHDGVLGQRGRFEKRLDQVCVKNLFNNKMITVKRQLESLSVI